MKKSRRAVIQRLPIAHAAWEFAIMPAPFTVADSPEIDGFVMIADASNGMVRGAGAVVTAGSWWDVLEPAFLAPVPPHSPARPSVIVTPDPETARALRAQLGGLSIAVEVGPTPHVDDALQSAASHLLGPKAPGLTQDLDRWATTLTSLFDIAPWEFLSDAVTFRFEGQPALAGAVAILLGLAGEQIGVVVYPTEADRDHFSAQMRAGSPPDASHVTASMLFVDPAEAFVPAELAACRAAGLALPGGHFPRAFAMTQGVPSELTPDQQRALLAAVQAVTALCARGVGPIDLAPQSMVASTCLGAVTIRSRPAPDHDPELLVHAAHMVVVGRMAKPGGRSRPAWSSSSPNATPCDSPGCSQASMASSSSRTTRGSRSSRTGAACAWARPRSWTESTSRTTSSRCAGRSC